MAVPVPVAGVSHYDVVGGRKVVPGGLPVHAIPRGHYDRHPVRAHFREPWDFGTAWCGAVVKVTLPMTFDAEADGACAACARAVASGAPEPDQQERFTTERPPNKLVEKVFLGFEKYEETPLQRGVRRNLPTEPGLAHAVSVYEHYPRAEQFLDHRYPLQAWCGVKCWVLTPNGFYEDESDACPECAKAWKKGLKVRPDPSGVTHRQLC